jgi:membrane protease YdiL (CAAX protease family)
MDDTPGEVVVANLVFMALWISATAVILVAGQRWLRLRSFRERMIAQWRPALAIAVFFVLGTGLGGRGFFNLYGLAVFCQALIGLTLARDIAGFEPLSVTQALMRREGILRRIAVMLLIALLMVPGIVAVGSVGMSVARQLFGEANQTAEAMGMLPQNKASVFFLLLAGAGIAEETVYRLVCLSFLWRLTGRRRIAIIVSSLVFAAYHLSPLDGMYRVFWQFPISQFLASGLIGMVFGYIYIKQGYETAVLSHTLSDWIPFILFAG